MKVIIGRFAPKARRGLAVLFVLPAALQAAEERPVYKCPGNIYTNAYSPKEAVAKGCKTLEGAPITVIQTTKPDVDRGEKPAPKASDSKVAPADQKARDTDARRILEAELRKEEEALAQLKKDYKDGQPERQGDEKNYQKYLDRVAEMKSAIARKEADIEAIKRELSKLPAP